MHKSKTFWFEDQPTELQLPLLLALGVGVSRDALSEDLSGVTCFQKKLTLHTAQGSGFRASVCQLYLGWAPDAGNSCVVCMGPGKTHPLYPETK